MGDTFTVKELAERITGGNEYGMRLLLKDAGAAIDEYAQNGDETVTREVVVNLFAIRAGDRVGRIASQLLAQP